MILEECRLTLRRSPTPQDAALHEAVGHAASLAPEVVALLGAFAAGRPLVLEDQRLMHYGLAALAVARRTEAFPTLCTALSDAGNAQRLTRAAYNLALTPILTALCGGDPEPLLALLEVPGQTPAVQGGVVAALAWLVREGRLAPERLLTPLDRIENADLSLSDPAWVGWQEAVLALHLTDRAQLMAEWWEGVGDADLPGTIDDEGAEEEDGLGEEEGAEEDDRLGEEEDAGEEDGWDDEEEEGAEGEEDWHDDEEEEDPEAARETARRQDWLRQVAEPPSPSDLLTIAPLEDPLDAFRGTTYGEDTDPTSGLAEDEREWLEYSLPLMSAKELALPLEMLDGYFTCRLLTPGPNARMFRLPKVPGDVDNAAPEDRLILACAKPLLDHRYQALAAQLASGAAVVPLLTKSVPAVAGCLWAQGFVVGMNETPDFWTRRRRVRDARLVLEDFEKLAGFLQSILSSLVGMPQVPENAEEMPDEALELALELVGIRMMRMMLAERIPDSIARLQNAVGPEPAQSAPRVGRNDPCPCGSGRKYKKCCGAPGALVAG